MKLMILIHKINLKGMNELVLFSKFKMDVITNVHFAQFHLPAVKAEV